MARQGNARRVGAEMANQHAEAKICAAEYRILKNNYSFVGAHANFAFE
jgi:hypothetical protein